MEKETVRRSRKAGVSASPCPTTPHGPGANGRSKRHANVQLLCRKPCSLRVLEKLFLPCQEKGRRGGGCPPQLESGRLRWPSPIFTYLAWGDKATYLKSGSTTGEWESVRVLLEPPPDQPPQHPHWATEDPLLAPTSSKSETEGVGVAVASPRRTGLNGDVLPSLPLPLARRPFPVPGFRDSVTSLGCFPLRKKLPGFPHTCARGAVLPPQVPSHVETLPLKMVTATICLRSSPGAPTGGLDEIGRKSWPDGELGTPGFPAESWRG